MKLRTIDTKPPQQVRVTVDGTTYDKLTAYLTYAAEHGQVFADVKQLLGEIARAFVDGGDKGFTAWYRAQSAAPQVPLQQANGHDTERPRRRTEDGHHSVPQTARSARGEGEEEGESGGKAR